MSRRQKEQRIVALWLRRPKNSRDECDVPEFADDLFRQGVRLADHQQTHYLHVMDLLRDLTNDHV